MVPWRSVEEKVKFWRNVLDSFFNLSNNGSAKKKKKTEIILKTIFYFFVKKIVYPSANKLKN